MGRIETVKVKCDKAPSGFYIKNACDVTEKDTVMKEKPSKKEEKPSKKDNK